MTDNTKKLTVKEFTHWLAGVEEMQELEWTPSPTQWRRIREKFNDIEQTASQAPTNNNVPQAVIRPQQMQNIPTYANSNIIPNPATDLAGRPFLPESSGIPARTPAIDTSNGQYNSAFA
jgi:hypothetical protein